MIAPVLTQAGCVMSGEHKGGRVRVYANAAERQAAYRARKGLSVSVLLEPALVDALDAYIDRQHRDGDVNATRSTVIAKLLRSQLLRKR